MTGDGETFAGRGSGIGGYFSENCFDCKETKIRFLVFPPLVKVPARTGDKISTFQHHETHGLFPLYNINIT